MKSRIQDHDQTTTAYAAWQHWLRATRSGGYTCKQCGACRSVRIDVAAFKMSRRWRKVLARNAVMEREASTARATREQFRLLKRYLDVRHPGGGMTDMEIRDYAGMVDASPVETVVFEYRNRLEAGSGDDGALQAAALTDVLRDVTTSNRPDAYPKNCFGQLKRNLGHQWRQDTMSAKLHRDFL